MIEAGYDCLENMVFSADDLMDSVEDMKQGHANRISRDAAAMLEDMGNVIAQVIDVTPKPVAPTGITGVDSSLRLAAWRSARKLLDSKGIPQKSRR